MIVEGVAGSGKSIVGLHRIAYLLSPFNQRPETISPDRVVFFGPTRTFLRYVSNLLPSLNVRDLQQVTLLDWMMSILSAPIRLDRGELLLEKLIRQKAENPEPAARAARWKGSRDMARALGRHVHAARRRFVSAASAIAVRVDAATLVVLKDSEVRRVLRNLAEGPLNAQRGRAIAAILDALWLEYRRQIGTRGETARSRQDFEQHVRAQLSDQLTSFWPVLDFRKAYRDFLSDESKLYEASRGLIKRQDARHLRDSLPKGVTVFDEEDIGALCYLDHLLNDHRTSQWEHVVVDEAQELSPIELLLLREHSRGNSFTILGDLTQSVSPQGIESWREIQDQFRGTSVSRFEARISFRATQEITKYANHVLRTARRGARGAIPFDRPGPKPIFTGSRSYEEMLESIERAVGEIKKDGLTTIGILCKSARDANRLHQSLRNRGMTLVGLLQRETVSIEDVVVAPIYLTRGLEYDAVILAGASKDHYPERSPLHSRLLYLGISRAAHQLRVHWFGQPATQLGVPKPVLPRPRVTKLGTKRKTKVSAARQLGRKGAG
jgi:DNA helicase-2/ATP-dependent DNA helicase PcrA